MAAACAMQTKLAGGCGLLARCYWELAALSIFAYSNSISNLDIHRVEFWRAGSATRRLGI